MTTTPDHDRSPTGASARARRRTADLRSSSTLPQTWTDEVRVLSGTRQQATPGVRRPKGGRTLAAPLREPVVRRGAAGDHAQPGRPEEHPDMALLTQDERARRDRERTARTASRGSRAIPADEPGGGASLTVWRTSQLPAPRTASAGVPFREGVASVLIGAVAYVPVALVTGYAAWNHPVALVLVLVLALSYALWSRRVVVGPGFVAVRTSGPVRVALAESVAAGGLEDSQRGGVLTLRTGDGRTMRLRRVEFSQAAVNATLRTFVPCSGRPYDEDVMQRLALPWREDVGHHRYLLDAVQ